MRLYHGTNKEFLEIDLLKSKPNKDFGRGFYLSADYNQALNMAHVKMEQLESGSPVVLEYEISEEAWDSLRVLRFENYSEEWAKFILLNRNNPSDQPVHDYDVVIGPIADDRVGVQCQYLQPIITQYFIDNKSEIWLLFLIAHSKR